MNLRIMLAVEDMKRHMTDEGNQLQEAFEHAGYKLVGHKYYHDETDVSKIAMSHPSTVVIQDKREWTNGTGDRKQSPAYRFQNIGCLKERDDIFKVGVLKDAHNDAKMHQEFAEQVGLHARIVYYDTDTVREVAPYTKNENLIRTYHTIDPTKVPEYSPIRRGCLLSGAVGGKAYPLRRRLFKSNLPQTTILRHPGYHRRGSQTNKYMEVLSKHKVAICTSSIYGYALRKIIEATACGCIVVTDLPRRDCLPGIDGNLVRIAPDSSPRAVSTLLSELYHSYRAERQKYYSDIACCFYDYRAMGRGLAENIEKLRKQYDHH